MLYFLSLDMLDLEGKFILLRRLFEFEFVFFIGREIQVSTLLIIILFIFLTLFIL